VPLTKIQNILLICFSLTYGFVLQALPMSWFLDRHNYINYADSSFNVLANFSASGLLPMLANEPIWLLINIALAQFFDPEAVVRVVIFVSTSILTYCIIKKNPKNAIWLLFFLLMPQLLKNHTTHLRQGLAMAVFYAGFFSRSVFGGRLLMALSPFIHASFFFILPIVLLPPLLKKLRYAIDVRLFVLAGFALVASLFLGFIASFFGARQVNYYDFEMTSVSGLGFVFWAIVFSLFIMQGKNFWNKYQEAIGVLVFYLCSYFLIEVTARILESGLPLILLAGLALTKWRRWAFISAFMLYGTIQWVLRLSAF